MTLFAYDDYFPAVATTDLLCRVADVLCCKARGPPTQLHSISCSKLLPHLAPQPSELAFYPIPKLMIRRVGDHEVRYTRDARGCARDVFEVHLRSAVTGASMMSRRQAYSALRASELGDGTLELREVIKLT